MFCLFISLAEPAVFYAKHPITLRLWQDYAATIQDELFVIIAFGRRESA
jgi:hypothetical protein